ncbi:MAG: hypothetical protein JRJ45_10220, partial [Deltaproteobacteria bacterium]|nr:hypothetical protein [Deltaproteobacteria bacterium]
MSNPQVIHNSGNNEWFTPRPIIECARRVMGSIDLDPASCDKANETVKATTYYTMQHNGLERTWHGNVWLNPPYGRALLTPFVDKLCKSLPDITQACVLVNNATETQWFNKLAIRADALCLIQRRIRFDTPD